MNETVCVIIQSVQRNQALVTAQVFVNLGHSVVPCPHMHRALAFNDLLHGRTHVPIAGNNHKHAFGLWVFIVPSFNGLSNRVGNKGGVDFLLAVSSFDPLLEVCGK